MYIPGPGHFDRRRQLGKSIEIDTLAEARIYTECIIDDWGKFALKDMDPESVVNLLFEINRSGSWKNRHISILKEIFAEASVMDVKFRPRRSPTFALNTKKADIFTTPELAVLFKPDNFPDTQFFLFFLLSLSGGLRLGEARAVRRKQINFEKNY
jgi:integrase